MEVSVWFSWRDSVSFFAPSSSISRSVHNQFYAFSWLIWLNIKNTNLQGITLSDPCFLSAWRLFPSRHRTEIGSLHFKTWHHQCNEMKNSAQSYHLCREQWVLCCTPVHDTLLLHHACGCCSLRVKKVNKKADANSKTIIDSNIPDMLIEESDTPPLRIWDSSTAPSSPMLFPDHFLHFVSTLRFPSFTVIIQTWQIKFP